MSVQDPVKAEILFDNNEYNVSTEKSEQLLLEIKGKQPYTCYQWGVWTTAHARASLEAGIDLCGDGLIYVDTDSCKYVGDVDWSSYNADRIQECELSGGWSDDPKGDRHYLGVFEDDGKYFRFCTLGAKKYAYEIATPDGPRLGVTISGVGKKRGAAELAAHGGLEAFAAAGQEGGSFTFANCGKTESVYTDKNTGEVMLDGHKIELIKNVTINEKEYTLSVTDDYASLLQTSSKMLNKAMQHWLNCRNR